MLFKVLANDLPIDHLDSMEPEARKKFLEELKAESAGVRVANNVGSVLGPDGSAKARRYGGSVNSTHIMCSVGAKFTPSVKGGRSANDAADEVKKKAQEVRERMKVIDSHLNTQLEIDTTHVEARRGGNNTHNITQVIIARIFRRLPGSRYATVASVPLDPSCVWSVTTTGPSAAPDGDSRTRLSTKAAKRIDIPDTTN